MGLTTGARIGPYEIVSLLGAAVAQDRVVFISNFFDELRRLAPAP